MNLQECQNKMIQLINQYSTNGSITDPMKNADYTLRALGLIDACQKEIASIFPIVKTVTFNQTKALLPSDFASYDIPSGFKNVISVMIRSYPEYLPIEYIQQDNKILVNPKLGGTIVMKYSKNPDDITDSTDLNTELEILPELQEVVPYYVAGHVYLEDNATIATLLLNEYENKLAKIKYPPVVTQNKVKNGWGW